MPEETPKTVTIRLPGGYAPEDGKMPGDRVRAVVEFELGENPGEATVISVDGSKYDAVAVKPQVAPEEEVEAVVVAPESEDPFAAKLMAQS
jgi:hypothetical protein